jgi:hypothetical protein
MRRRDKKRGGLTPTSREQQQYYDYCGYLAQKRRKDRRREGRGPCASASTCLQAQGRQRKYEMSRVLSLYCLCLSVFSSLDY